MASGAGLPKPPSTAGSSQPPPATARRERLENILQRETTKDQLIIKLRDRMSRQPGDDQVSVGSAAIHREVDRFLGTSATITEANLERLERRLHRQAQGKPGTDAESDAVCSVSEYTMGSAAPSFGSRASQPRGAALLSARGPGQGVSWSKASQGSTPGSARGAARSGGLTARGKSVGTGTPRTPSLGSRGVVFGAGVAAVAPAPDASPQPGVEWSVLDKLAAKQLEEDAQRQRAREQELQRRLRKDLDRQVADQRMVQDREKQHNQSHFEQQVEAYRQHCEQEREKELVRQQKMIVQKHERHAQVELVHARKEEEKLKEMEDARAMKEQIFKQEQEEKKKKEESMGQQRVLALQALEVGSEALRKREEEKQKVAELEEKRLQEYRQRKDDRDKVAKEAKEKEEQIRRARFTHAASLAASEKKHSEVAASKTQAESEEKDRQAAEFEKANKARLETLRQQNKEYLFEQMKSKKDKKHEEKERTRQLRQDLEQDAKKYMEDEQKRMAARTAQNQEQRTVLEQQIAKRMQPAPNSREVMSDCEMRLNRPLLERIGCKPLALANVPHGAASVAC